MLIQINPQILNARASQRFGEHTEYILWEWVYSVIYLLLGCCTKINVSIDFSFESESVLVIWNSCMLTFHFSREWFFHSLCWLKCILHNYIIELNFS
ncbi:hypothetical protein RJT34_09724 [Clitoria ternatea]|uniref:Uncharacterized protein n=1 Tax=Clitoria ternatea TaxID=43366 RepID=A0AAN9K7M2_CLITE